MMSIGWCSRCVGWVMIRWFRWCSQWSEGCCCGGQCVVCIYFLVGVCKVQQRVTTWVSTIFFRNLNLQSKVKKMTERRLDRWNCYTTRCHWAWRGMTITNIYQVKVIEGLFNKKMHDGISCTAGYLPYTWLGSQCLINSPCPLKNLPLSIFKILHSNVKFIRKCNPVLHFVDQLVNAAVKATVICLNDHISDTLTVAMNVYAHAHQLLKSPWISTDPPLSSHCVNLLVTCISPIILQRSTISWTSMNITNLKWWDNGK